MEPKDMKLTYILSILTVKVLSALSQDICNPYTTCAVSQPGDYVIDPSDYQSYFVCIQDESSVVPSDDSFSCGSGMCFDPSSQVCESQTGPSCYNECVNTCNVTCSSQSIIASTNSCSDYYLCVAGNPIPESCPVDRPYFDGSDCVSTSTSCCDVCYPRCPSGGVQVYDPYDCNRFYVCENAGDPNWNLHGTCSDGQIFSPIYGRCEVGSACTPAC